MSGRVARLMHCPSSCKDVPFIVYSRDHVYGVSAEPSRRLPSKTCTRKGRKDQGERGIHGLCSVPNIIRLSKSSGMMWAEHVAPN
jgi:hypothetical protein